ncbi:hypothetical protein ACFYM2_27620 [Streptomyces sp. NPDC006711]|uniref:hypothetical protein n=1 Tax=unclassified Streptomyces TaxID=2593676 RepID=UPI0036A18188
MSFGDPNNPYGQQPQQGANPYGQQPGQPGYGYPQGQQAPQGVPPQQGYGYPQQPYGGAPMGPQTMPGTVSAARAMLWVIVGLQAIGAVIMVIGAIGMSAAKNQAAARDDVQFQQLADYPTGVLYVMAVFAVAWLIFAIVLAAKFGTGGNGLRVTTMVFAIVTAVLGIYPFVVIGLIHTVLAILIAVFVGKQSGAQWFKRPQY